MNRLNLTKVRENLHKIPELGFEEWETQKYILSILKNFGEINIKTFDFPGIVAEYKFNDDDDYLLFRADMDALPVNEETGADFSSENDGKMHACGHDIHMTVLIGLIERVLKNKSKRNILFVFQPAEEGKGGALKLLSTGYLDQFSIKEAYALHVTGYLPVGTISCKKGIIFGIPQEFDVIIKGQNSHVAFPEKGNDALIAGMSFYQNMKNAIYQNFSATDSIVFSVGKMQAGTVRNVIPKDSKLEGTLRVFSKENFNKMKSLMLKTAENIAEIYDVKIEVKFLSYFDPVVNDEDLYLKLKENLPENYCMETVKAKLVGEDFGFFTSRYKGLLFWLGTGVEDDLHTSTFLPKPETIEVGVNTMFSLI